MMSAYLSQLTAEQRAVILKPMDWSKTAVQLRADLAVAKPEYRAGIEQMLRVASAKVAQRIATNGALSH